jgi:hypothetical protein
MANLVGLQKEISQEQAKYIQAAVSHKFEAPT